MNDISKEMASQFSNIEQSWDHNLERNVWTIHPGDYCIINNNDVLCTVLGTCIAVTILDVKNHITGMNHFLLPDDNGKANSKDSYSARYGCWAMEHLINDMIKYGAERKHMEFKYFGASRLLKMKSVDVAGKNIAFIENFMKEEGIRVRSKDVGGSSPRKIFIFPDTGKVLVKKLSANKSKDLEKEEKTYFDSINENHEEGDVDIFF